MWPSIILRYLRHPVMESHWDDGVFTFIRDILPGHHIEIVWFPAHPFHRLPARPP